MKSTHLLFDLAEQGVVLFDGAMGTMLIEAGLTAGGPPELWNIEKPEIVAAIHQAYYDAGSHVVHTNTFGANEIKLGEYDRGNDMAAINRAAAKIARKACPAGKLVAGDLGPSAKMLKPVGDADPETLEAAYRRQASVLLEFGVDFISIETMFSLEEALCAVRGAKGAGDCPIAASMTYDRKPAGFYTMMGEDVLACVKALEAVGVDVIGSNCGLGSKDMIDLAAELRKATRRPVLIQPNAGQPVSTDGNVRYAQTAREFSRDIRAIMDAGIDMVGGCCGTNADFIRAIKERRE